MRSLKELLGKEAVTLTAAEARTIEWALREAVTANGQEETPARYRKLADEAHRLATHLRALGHVGVDGDEMARLDRFGKLQKGEDTTS